MVEESLSLWQGSLYETKPKQCTMHYYKGNPLNYRVFVLFDPKKLGTLMTPAIGHLLLPSEYHTLRRSSQPTNFEFPANSINTAPTLFATPPFETKLAAKIRLLNPTGQNLAKLHENPAFEGFKSSFFMGGIR